MKFGYEERSESTVGSRQPIKGTLDRTRTETRYDFAQYQEQEMMFVNARILDVEITIDPHSHGNSETFPTFHICLLALFTSVVVDCDVDQKVYYPIEDRVLDAGPKSWRTKVALASLHYFVSSPHEGPRPGGGCRRSQI
jgi:hypothetical protein